TAFDRAREDLLELRLLRPCEHGVGELVEDARSDVAEVPAHMDLQSEVLRVDRVELCGHQRSVVSRPLSTSSASTRLAASRARSGSSPKAMSIASRTTAAIDEPRRRAIATTRSNR